MISYVERVFVNGAQGWGYSVSMLDNFLLTLFEKYAELLKRRFSEDFQEVSSLINYIRCVAEVRGQIVSTDDYMPMAINSLEEYEKVLNVSWFTQEKPIEQLTYVVRVIPHLPYVANHGH